MSCRLRIQRRDAPRDRQLRLGDAAARASTDAKSLTTAPNPIAAFRLATTRRPRRPTDGHWPPLTAPVGANFTAPVGQQSP